VLVEHHIGTVDRDHAKIERSTELLGRNEFMNKVGKRAPPGKNAVYYCMVFCGIALSWGKHKSLRDVEFPVNHVTIPRTIQSLSGSRETQVIVID
jgi:hypothetical protein